jgi:hypothetical protein
MSLASELIRESQKEKIWSKFCGHYDLSINEFMDIQERLLFEQFDLWNGSEIGKHFFGKNTPKTVTEFRERVPLTTYDDYVDFLLKRDESLLPKAHYRWARTSGRSGKYECKWVPLTDRFYEKHGDVAIAAMILSSCKYKGDVRLESDDVLLLATPPLPYSSAYVTHATADLLDARFVPPLEEGEKMEFSERVAVGFRMGMDTGIDYFYGLASVLAKMGERFEEGGGGSTSMKGMKLKTILRLMKGMAVAKLNHRNLLPKDIWKLKGVMTGGMDTDIYRSKVEHYWGKMPLEGYGCTEGAMQCLQGWNYKGMTFFPDINFYEYIPLDEHLKNKEDPSYTPKTVLTNELKPGIYEIVFTNLLGGVLMRYRVGDMFKVESIGDEEIGCALPQFRFYSRGDDLIDLSNFVRFTEKSLWQSIEAADIDYVDWIAKKDVENGKPYLHLYIEFPHSDHMPLSQVHDIIEEKIRENHSEYAGLEEVMGDHNLEISELPNGAFKHYIESQQAAGADLAHIKPPHMQPKDSIFKKLINMN